MSARRFLFSLFAVVFCLLVPAAASAAPITIGQLPLSTPPAICMNDIDHFQVGVASGSDYRVPDGYTEITSWSTYAAFGAGQEMALKVIDEQSSTQYVVIRADGPRQLGSGSVNTFPVKIPVGKGDIIGLNSGNASPALPNACSFVTGLEADQIATRVPGIGLHETGEYKTGTELRVNVSVTLAKPPALTLISPASGSAAGGTSVTLAGHDLTGAEEVRFGAAKAQFKVLSDDEIEATAPAASATGPVDVTVTTAAGTTPKVEGDRFTFFGAACGCVGGPLPTQIGRARCVVPNLRNRKLKSVRKALTKADCRLGKVSGAKGKGAKVKKQGAKAGTKLPAGSRVSVRLAAP